MEEKVIALGFFDGVHLGHGRLLMRAKEQAESLGLQPAALTFDQHPLRLITGKSVPLLTNPAERERLMKSLYGIEWLLTLHFDEKMRDMPWEQFLDEVLLKRYGGRHFVCGHDFCFGAKGQGTAKALQEKCRSLGLGCDIIPEYKLEGVTVSSTYIRNLVAQGQMETAARFLGHPYTLTGTVIPGKKLGRTIGIPTANLMPPQDVLLPVRGVYACRVWVQEQSFFAVTNLGLRPTVQGTGLLVEPWLLDFAGDLYGQELRVEFWKFLRPERCFSSLSALQEEILRNEKETRAFFAGGIKL